MSSKQAPKTLDQTFKDTIDSATSRLKRYKTDVNKFKGLVTEQTARLQTLLQRLRDCIGKLKALRDSYNDYNTRITQVRSRISILLTEARRDGSTQAGEECNEKIKGLIEKFQQLNAEIGDFDDDEVGKGLRSGIDDLSQIIKELCDETEGILGNMTQTRDEINTGLTELQGDVDSATAAAASESVPPESGSEGRGESKSGASKSEADEEVGSEKEESAAASTVATVEERKYANFEEFEAAFLGEATRLKSINKKYKMLGAAGSEHRTNIRRNLRNWVTDNSKGMKTTDHEMFGSSESRNKWLDSEMRTVVFPPGSIQRGGKNTRKRRGGWRDAEKNSPVRSLTMKIEKKNPKKKKRKKSTKKRKKLKIKKSRKKGKKK